MSEANEPTVARALISVSDKSGIIEFAAFLHSVGIEILSTGGTAELLEDNDIPVIEVSTYTGFPELMSGRLKTLHPKVHGGILGRRGVDEADMELHGIKPFDLVIVNLYPFEQTIAQPDIRLEQAIENIDIGGPTMVRASAKNYDGVTVVVDPLDYPHVMAEMQKNHNAVSRRTRLDLAVKAFEHTARYDDAIANFLGTWLDEGTKFPRTINFQFKKSQTMRYGENPHQNAAFFHEIKPQEVSVTTARQLQGKALSYNNIADTDAALECVKQFVEPACVIVKHANPCGVAVADSIINAYERAYQTDPTSAFGGIIAFNRPLDGDTAATIIDRQFVEVIIAPGVSEEAKSALNRKPNIRLMECNDFGESVQSLDFKRVNGGLLVQDRDIVAGRKLFAPDAQGAVPLHRSLAGGEHK